MDILVVSVREGDSRIAALSVSDKGVAVKGLVRTASALSPLVQGNSEAVASVIGAAIREMKNGFSKVVFLLPLSLFQMECLPTSAAIKPGWQNDLTRWAEKSLCDECTRKQVRLSMVRNRGTGVFVSAVALQQDVIETIEAAMGRLKKQLLRIEPECFGLLRNAGDRGFAVVEPGEEWTQVAAFSPDRGLFALSIPTPENAEWEDSMKLIDFAASQAFSAPPSVFTVLSRTTKFAGNFPEGSRKSLAAHRLCPAPVSIHKSVAVAWEDFAPLIAAAPPPVVGKEPMAALTDSVNANFVRVELVQKQSQESTDRYIAMGLKGLLAAGVIVIAVNIGVLAFYFLTEQNKLPQKLQQEYITAQQTIASLDKKTNLIQRAARESSEAVKIVDSIAAIRPADVKIHRLEINEGGAIIVEGHAALAEIGNVFVDRMKEGGQIVRSAYLEKIMATSNQRNTFLIKAQR